MNRLKYIIIGFALATMMFLLMGSSTNSRGNSKYNPVYVKVVD